MRSVRRTIRTTTVTDNDNNKLQSGAGSSGSSGKSSGSSGNSQSSGTPAGNNNNNSNNKNNNSDNNESNKSQDNKDNDKNDESKSDNNSDKNNDNNPNNKNKNSGNKDKDNKNKDSTDDEDNKSSDASDENQDEDDESEDEDNKSEDSDESENDEESEGNQGELSEDSDNDNPESENEEQGENNNSENNPDNEQNKPDSSSENKSDSKDDKSDDKDDSKDSNDKSGDEKSKDKSKNKDGKDNGDNGVMNSGDNDVKADKKSARGDNGVMNSDNGKKKKPLDIKKIPQLISQVVLAAKAVITSIMAAIMAKIAAMMQALVNALMNLLAQIWATVSAIISAIVQVAFIAGMTMAFGVVGFLIALTIVICANADLASIFESYEPYVYHKCFDEYDAAYRGLFGSLDSAEGGNSGAAKYIQEWDDNRKKDPEYENYLRNMLGTVQKVRSFFRTYGLTDTQCAAICGYLYHSGMLDPTFVEPVDMSENSFDKQWFKTPLESDAKGWIAEKDYSYAAMLADEANYPMTASNPDTKSISSVSHGGLERVGIGIGKWRDYNSDNANTRLREFTVKLNEDAKKVDEAIKAGKTWQADLRIECQNRWNVIFGGSQAVLGADNEYDESNYKPGEINNPKQYYVIGEPSVINDYRTYTDKEVQLPWVDEHTGYNNSDNMTNGTDGESLEYLLRESRKVLEEKYNDYIAKYDDFNTAFTSYKQYAWDISQFGSSRGDILFGKIDTNAFNNMSVAFSNTLDKTEYSIDDDYAASIGSPIKYELITTRPEFDADSIYYVVPSVNIRSCINDWLDDQQYGASCQTIWLTMDGYRRYIVPMGNYESLGWNGFSPYVGFNSNNYNDTIHIGSESLGDAVDNSFNTPKDYINLRAYDKLKTHSSAYQFDVNLEDGLCRDTYDVNDYYNIIDGYRTADFYNGGKMFSCSTDDQYFGFIPSADANYTPNAEDRSQFIGNMNRYWLPVSGYWGSDGGLYDSSWWYIYAGGHNPDYDVRVYQHNDSISDNRAGDSNYMSPYDFRITRSKLLYAPWCKSLWQRYAISDRPHNTYCADVDNECGCLTDYINDIQSNYPEQMMWIHKDDSARYVGPDGLIYWYDFGTPPPENWGVAYDSGRVLKKYDEKLADLRDSGTQFENNANAEMTNGFNPLLNNYGQAYDEVMKQKEIVKEALDELNVAIDDYNAKVKLKAEALSDYYNADDDRYEANKRYIEDEVRDMIGGNDGIYWTSYAKQYIIDKYFADIWGDYNGNIFPIWKKYIFNAEPPEDGLYIHWWDIDVQLLYMVSDPMYVELLESWDGNEARDMKASIQELEKIFNSNVVVSEAKNTAYAFYYLFQYGSPYAMNLRTGNKRNAIDDIIDTWTNIEPFDDSDGGFMNYYNHDYYDDNEEYPVIWNPYAIDNSYGYSLLQAADMTYQRSKVNTMGMLANSCYYIDTLDNSSFAKASLLLIDKDSYILGGGGSSHMRHASKLYFWVSKEIYTIYANGGAEFPFRDVPVEHQQELVYGDVKDTQVQYGGEKRAAQYVYADWFGSAARWLSASATWSGADKCLYPEYNMYVTIPNADENTNTFDQWFRWYTLVNTPDENKNPEFQGDSPNENGNLRQHGEKEEDINGQLIERDYLKDKFDKDKGPNETVDNSDKNKWAKIDVRFDSDNWKDVLREGDVIMTKNPYSQQYFVWYGDRLVSEIYPDANPKITKLDEDGNPVVDSDGNTVMITDSSRSFVAGYCCTGDAYAPALADIAFFEETVVANHDDWVVIRLINPDNDTTCRNAAWDFMTNMQYSQDDLDKLNEEQKAS